MFALERASPLLNCITTTHPRLAVHHVAAQLAGVGDVFIKTVTSGGRAAPNLADLAVEECHVERRRR